MRVTRRVAILFPVLLLAQASQAQEAADAGAAGKKKAGVVRVAVMDLTARGVPEDTAATVSEVLAAELGKRKDLDVITSSDVKSLLTLDQTRQLLGCGGDAACFSQLGGLLEAERLISGSIGALGNALILNLQYIDTAEGQVISRASVQSAEGKEALAQAARDAAGSLLQIPARIHVYPQVEGARVLVNDQLLGVMPLPPAPYQGTGKAVVRVEHYDYPVAESEVELTPGRVSRVKVDMISFAELETLSARRATTGWILLAGGLAGLGGGGFLTARGWGLASDYQALDPRRTTQAQFDSMAADSRLNLGVGYTLLGVGAALGTAAVWLLASDPYADRLATAGSGGGIVFEF